FSYHACLLVVLNIPYSLFYFKDTATTKIYTPSLHDALPIYRKRRETAWRDFLERSTTRAGAAKERAAGGHEDRSHPASESPNFGDRKSTRLNSSHVAISYAVFCLKKKKQLITRPTFRPFPVH